MSLHDALDIALTVALALLAGVYLHRTLVQRHSSVTITVKDTGVFPAATTVTGMSTQEALDVLRRIQADREAHAEARRLRAEARKQPPSTASDHTPLAGPGEFTPPGQPLTATVSVVATLDNICRDPDCERIHGAVTDTNTAGTTSVDRSPIPPPFQFEPRQRTPKIAEKFSLGQRSPGRNIDPTPEDDES
jgi:hypothetical protein